MAEELAFRHGGEDVVAAVTAVHITASGLASNVAQTPEGIESETPAAPISYYLVAVHDEPDPADTLVGPVFGDVGAWTWDGVIFPAAGTWNVSIMKVGAEPPVKTEALEVLPS